MDAELIILGCGGAAGVPAIGNWWGNCDSTEPKNIRTRPSIAIKTSNGLIVIDSGPDFRTQMNRENLGCPDAIFITHHHSDHTAGIDEFRTLQRLHKGMKFPLYAMNDTMKDLHERLGYMFVDSENGFYPSVFDAKTIDLSSSINLIGIDIHPFAQMHGDINSLGVRIGNIAYSTDVKKLDDNAFNILRGVETWIVDAAGHDKRTNPVHACIDEIFEMNAIIGAKNVYLTHLPPSMDYQTLCRELPNEYAPAYDGLRFKITL